MSTTLIIVLIIVVWLVVLAPLIFRGQKPIRHSGDGFNDTRVVFSGGNDVLKVPPRPRMANARVGSEADTDQSFDYELVDAEEYEIIDEPWHKREQDQAAGKDTAEDSTDYDDSDDLVAASDRAVADSEIIDGEVIADDGVTGQDPTGEATTVRADIDGDEAATVDDQQVTPATATADVAEEDQQSRRRVFVTDLAPEEMYGHDETYTSPVDLLYPGVTDADAVITRSASEPEELVNTSAHEETSTAESAEDVDSGATVIDQEADAVETGERASTRGSFGIGAYREAELTLTEEELAFAARRSARGGWNPEAERQLQAQRTKRRRTTLLMLTAAVIITLVIAIPAGGWFWALPAGAVLLTVCYLLALRGQVQQEQQLRARRIQQLRRARMGVRNRDDDDRRPTANQNLRRPGARVLEIDDESPDFSELRTIDYQQADNQQFDYSTRTLHRPQQASRETTLRPVGRDGSLEEGRAIRPRGRRVV